MWVAALEAGSWRCWARTRLQAVMEQRGGGRGSARSLAFAFALFAACGVAVLVLVLARGAAAGG
jgi:hypothetical protein